MTQNEHFQMVFQMFKDVVSVPVPTTGVLTVALISCAMFGIQTYFNFTEGVLSIGACVFQNGHLYGILLFPFYHKTFAQLLLSIATLPLLSGSLEKGFGTLRFLLLFLLMSTTIGSIYSFLDYIQIDSSPIPAEGLLPVALACVSAITKRTKMTRSFLCGVSFPTMALPLVLLIITTALVPHSVLTCNVLAILVGWMYGKGWFSALDLSEARAGVVEKMVPFRWLRSIRGVMFVPASREERNKTLLPQINPTPGSYPVQAYAPVSSINTAGTTAESYEGWPNLTGTLSGHSPPPNPLASAHGFGLSHGHPQQNIGHSCNHSHGQL
ncbi:rhomboid domain-containing protein 2 [Morone saxatilis]|uniref:rhomboid domain-containing protein 2 n=1 Tax=Morone saxatilis TaxID=34816 RepID=UPI0015E1F82A|nr:rhomboid domain-containing protein 2 [Morone saxatilis]